MRGNFLPRWRLTEPQNHRYRPAGSGIIDMDGQETALVVMNVEQRKLLMSVYHVERIVDVKRDGSWRRRLARAIAIDYHLTQPDDLPQRRRILPGRHGRLRARVCFGVRQAPAGNFERRSGTHIIETIGVFIATRNGENAGTQNVRQRADGSYQVAPMGDRRRQFVGDHQLPLRPSQKHDAAVGANAAALERSGDLLAANGWKCKVQIGTGLASTTESYAASVSYATLATSPTCCHE